MLVFMDERKCSGQEWADGIEITNGQDLPMNEWWRLISIGVESSIEKRLGGSLGVQWPDGEGIDPLPI